MASPSLKLRSKTVTVTVDPDLGTATPDTFCISKKGKEEVQWVSASGTPFKVHFDESPFKDSDFDDSKPHSGLPVVRADKTKVYKYTVKGKHKTIDPGGIINP